MRIKDMPAWVLKFKKTGYTVRYQNNQFRLLKVTSIRTPDKPYPKLIQEFVGIITKDGLIPKKVHPNKLLKAKKYEYGLSNFLFLNFKRALKRTIHIAEFDDVKNILVLASIVIYLFGSLNDAFLKRVYLAKTLNVSSFNHFTERRAKLAYKLKDTLVSLLKEKIANEVDRALILFMLRNVLIDDLDDIYYPKELLKLLKEYNLKYE